ncbi:hypothetical protein [Streptomyces antimycoticus]|uniref:hypothetical protein n=1 Tax=Streptomyces antimycoticus TaxID=68175 RepID=UPI0033E59BEE
MKHRPHHPRHPRPDHRVPAPGQVAYDPASGRTGVIQAVHTVAELLFDHQMSGPRFAFLRPEGGGVEWTADAAALRFPTPGQGDA